MKNKVVYDDYEIFRNEDGKLAITFITVGENGERIGTKPELLRDKNDNIKQNLIDKAIEAKGAAILNEKLSKAKRSRKRLKMPEGVKIGKVNNGWFKKFVGKHGHKAAITTTAIGAGILIAIGLGADAKINANVDKDAMPKDNDKNIEGESLPSVPTIADENVKDLSAEEDGIITYEEAIKDIQKIKYDYQEQGYFKDGKIEGFDDEVERQIASLYVVANIDILPKETVNKLVEMNWINATYNGIKEDANSIIEIASTQESQYASGYDDLEYSNKHIDLSPFFRDPNAKNMYESTQKVLDELKNMNLEGATKEEKEAINTRAKEIYNEITNYAIADNSIFGNMSTSIGGSYLVNNEVINLTAIMVEKGLITTKDYLAIAGTHLNENGVEVENTEINYIERLIKALEGCTSINMEQGNVKKK